MRDDVSPDRPPQDDNEPQADKTLDDRAPTSSDTGDVSDVLPSDVLDETSGNLSDAPTIPLVSPVSTPPAQGSISGDDERTGGAEDGMSRDEGSQESYDDDENDEEEMGEEIVEEIGGGNSEGAEPALELPD